jgi:hypothetical protein
VNAIIREYDAKMAQLKAIAEAEKQAILSQNAAAAEQARIAREQLTGELVALKKAYDELVSNLTATTSAYESKLAQLEAAKRQELEAVRAQNSAAVAAAQAEQTRLQSEIAALKESSTSSKAEYEQAVAALKAAQQQEIDAAKSQNTALAEQARAAQVELQKTISELEAKSGVSSQEIASLKAMLAGGGGLDRTIYVIVHAPSWTDHAELKVLTLSTTGNIGVETYRNRDYAQTFAMSATGATLRCLSGNGLYIADEGCSTPVASESFAAPWTLFATGRHELERHIISKKCGRYLSSELHGTVSFEESPTGWYFVPVGSLS